MSSRQLDCEEVIELLFDYLDSEVSNELGSRIERHLKSCRDCFSRAEFEKHLRAKVRETAVAQAPERLQNRISEVLERF